MLLAVAILSKYKITDSSENVNIKLAAYSKPGYKVSSVRRFIVSVMWQCDDSSLFDAVIVDDEALNDSPGVAADGL